MFQKARPIFFTAETPLHAGSGDSLGIVDLPIQRERHTSFPKIEASTLKGALRVSFEGKFLEEYPHRNHPDVIRAFGPEESASEHAGALGFTDAKLFLFPVKSMKGVFAWITCPKVLKQLSSDLELSIAIKLDKINKVEDGYAAPLSKNNELQIGEHFVLEEYTFKKNDNTSLQINGTSLTDWIADNFYEKGSFWYEKIKKDILVLSDNDFKDFVNLSTEVITRTKINNKTGTVKDGALFTEEYLPADSVLYSLILSSEEFVTRENANKKEYKRKSADEILSFFSDNLNQVIQLGGNATLGKGILRTKIIQKD